MICPEVSPPGVFGTFVGTKVQTGMRTKLIFNSSRVINAQIYELSTYSTLEELVHGTCTHLRENPPLKEVSACGQRTLCSF